MNLIQYSSQDLIKYLIERVHFLEQLVTTKGDYSLDELEEAEEKGKEIMQANFPEIDRANIK